MNIMIMMMMMMTMMMMKMSWALQSCKQNRGSRGPKEMVHTDILYLTQLPYHKCFYKQRMLH